MLILQFIDAVDLDDRVKEADKLNVRLVIRDNKNTRMAYYRAACHFFAWVEQHEIGELADIEPIHVAAYIEVLQMTAAKPSVKLHLAAIRNAVRLARRRPGPCREPGARGARAEACRAPGQDAGAHRGPGPAAVGEHQGREEGHPA
jgi:hypothetical protein